MLVIKGAARCKQHIISYDLVPEVSESIGHTNQDDDHHLEEHDGQDLDDQSHDTEETSTMFIFRTPAIS